MINKTEDIFPKVNFGTRQGLIKGWKGLVWLLKIILPISLEHMTLIAIFTLISHNIIQESIVQGNSGTNTVFAVFFRLFMALAVTFICAKIMGVTPETGGLAGTGTYARDSRPFMVMLNHWGWTTFKLTVQIFCIIMPLMVVLELAKVFKIINFITRIVSPVLSVMGLNRSTGILVMGSKTCCRHDRNLAVFAFLFCKETLC
jgi:hypothetical protein